MPEAEQDADMALVKRHALELGEHFDAVQIFASRHEPEIENGTVSATYGVGNWFARYGKVREWLLETDERTRNEVRRED